MVALLTALAGVSLSCLMGFALIGVRGDASLRGGQRIPLEREPPLA